MKILRRVSSLIALAAAGHLIAPGCATAPRHSIKGEVRVQKMPKIHVAYAEHKGLHEGGGGIYDALLGKLTGWAVPNGYWDFPRTTRIICIYPDPPGVPASERRLWLGITLPKTVPAPAGIITLTIPENTYAVGSFVIAEREFADAWGFMYERWLPENGYLPAEGLSFELQKNDSCTHPEKKHVVDICIPVRRDESASMPKTGAEREQMLGYYAAHGPVTDPGEYAALYDGLPSDVGSLCAVVHGVMLHIFMADKYGVTIPGDRKNEVQLRTAERMLGRILELDGRPLTVRREPLRRMVGNCRDHSVILASILKSRGIPARARCGFATYFIPGRYVDHWIVEYWNAARGRWVRVDPQLDGVQVKALGIGFDPLDLPPGTFMSAGEIWRLCRAGKLDPDLCGILEMHGLWFVQGDLVRDVMALNRVEVLPWDWNNLMTKEREPTAGEYRLLDRAAELTTAEGVGAFEEIRALYDAEPSLRMPPSWKP